MYSFGYLKVVSVFVCVNMLAISITGFLLNHRHDFGWMETARISTSLLPERYQTRLDDVREALRRGDIEAAAKLGRIYALKLLAG